MAIEKKLIPYPEAALERADLTCFRGKDNLAAVRAVIRDREHLKLSARDSLRVLELLETPPKPNARLRAAAKALSKPK